MAIRRCPYCKAIIDESQKYCNNCGTQLLFPEDEKIEEPIKGKKIIDEDAEDSSEAEFEKSLEVPLEEEAEEEKEEIDLEEVLEGGAPFPGEERAEPATEDLEPEPEPEAAKETEELTSELERKIEAEKELERELISEEESEQQPELETEPEKELEPEGGPEPQPEPEHEPEPEPEPDRQAEIEAKPEPEPEVEIEYIKDEPDAELKVAEERLRPAPILYEKTPEFIEKKVVETAEDPVPGETEEVSEAEEAVEEIKDEELEMETPETKAETDTREEISRLLEALEKKHRKAVLTKEEERIIAPLEETSDIPAWAEKASGAESEEFRPEEESAAKTGEKSFAAGDTVDFEEEVMQRAERMSAQRPTVGIPETVTKIDDFEVSGGKDFEKGGVSGGAMAGTVAPRSRLGFVGRIKAFLFDVSFVAAFWLVAVGLASRVMSVSIGPLVAEAAVPLGLLFIILLSGYFFLFFFFLGETLGGRLFAPRH